jgi:hypothetical protein
MPQLKRPPAYDMCPPGYHVVRGHERIYHSGTRTWVDEHIARNSGSRKSMFLIENIHYLFWNSKKEYKKLKSIKEFEGKDEYDSPIQFWLDSWKEKGLKFPNDLDPLMIKAMIAVESRFRPEAKSKVKGSSASGLMQLTNQSRRILSGRPDSDGYREMKSDYLNISDADVFEPIINIAGGIRWLSYKYTKIKKGAEKNAFNAIKNYHSWDEEGEKYAKKVMEKYKASK